MSACTKHRTILAFRPNAYQGYEGPMVHFSQEHDEGEAAEAFLLSVGCWDGMGCPTTITVTVEPGDLLN